MPTRRAVIPLVVLFAVVSVVLASTIPTSAASKYKVLGRVCCLPYGTLALDASGNLYGTSSAGGSGRYGGCENAGCGTVFELVRGTNGNWTKRVLHNFDGADGIGPSAGLIFDAAGNLYGTTGAGGDLQCALGYGCGTVFELSPGADGKWTEKTLYRFTGQGDGGFPEAGLVLDSAGNLYGTTYEGGDLGTVCYDAPIGGCGTVFELVPGNNAQWTETVLYQFTGTDGDGAYPLAGLIFDASGNLYGTTSQGGGAGGCGCGSVFQLIPGAGGTWTENVLHRFSGKDGYSPRASLILDAAGNLYGTTAFGGAACKAGFCGTVFELTPGAHGEWSETILRSFYKQRSPVSPLIFDATGNLYGTTDYGGKYSSEGIVFELAPGANGVWSEKTLHSFGKTNDGAHPQAGLIADTTGNFYGITSISGNGSDDGVVFEITQ
jgi:uncharacterized repeat protein (TIGR03803 family)